MTTVMSLDTSIVRMHAAMRNYADEHTAAHALDLEALDVIEAKLKEISKPYDPKRTYTRDELMAHMQRVCDLAGEMGLRMSVKEADFRDVWCDYFDRNYHSEGWRKEWEPKP